MSLQPQNLNDYLKSAQEVSSLSNTDNVLVADSNGNAKKVSKSVLDNIVSFTVKANTWYRIVSTVGNLASVGQLLVASSPLEQECFSLKWSIPRSSYFSKSLIDIFNPRQSFSYTIMTKLRVCRPSSSAYGLHFDVFFTAAKTVTVRLDASLNANINIIEDPTTENLTVFEYDMNVVGGGGKPLFHNILHNLAERRVA